MLPWEDRCNRVWVGSEVVSSLQKLLSWPEAQVYSDGRSAGGWPELCQGPLPPHVLWLVACSQDSAASTAPLCSHISFLLHYDWNPLLCLQPYRHLITDQTPVISTHSLTHSLILGSPLSLLDIGHNTHPSNTSRLLDGGK